MRLRWALVISVIGFFLITGIIFVYTPDNIYYGGAVRLGCHSVTASELQTLKSFYQTSAPTYVPYFYWLGHGLLGQWQPQLSDCPEGIDLGSSVTYFVAGLVVWVILTIGVVAYSLATRHRILSSPST